MVYYKKFTVNLYKTSVKVNQINQLLTLHVDKWSIPRNVRQFCQMAINLRNNLSDYNYFSELRMIIEN